MTHPLPRVLIFYTGGTFGMDAYEDHRGGAIHLNVPTLSPRLLKKRIFERLPELHRLAQCEVDIILNRDSSHIGPPEWLLMAGEIRKKWRNFDGIVILHGTDSLAYTASALSLLLNPCHIPVVITGAQRPLTTLRTDARSNLISAVEIAAHGPRKFVNQVTVFFGDKLFQGNQVRKTSSSDFQAFDSPHAPPLAIVGTTIRYSNNRVTRKQPKINFKSKIDGKVLLLHITPGFPAAAISRDLLPSIDALVWVVFQSWTAPTHDPAFMDLLKATKAQQIPIIIVTENSSQQPQEETQKINYAAGNALLTENTFFAYSMTPEYAYVKTLLLLSQWRSRSISEFSTLWRKLSP